MAPKRMSTIARFAIAGVTLVFGLYLADFTSPKRAAFGIILFALPLLCQSVRYPLVRAYGLWGACFLVLQSLIPPGSFAPSLGTRDYVTLPPNWSTTLDFLPEAETGIIGAQHISTDERGFRVLPPVDYAHKSGLRIFAIGGSTTENIFVDDARTWPHLLQENLKSRLGRRVEVINTGVSGLVARHHLGTLQKILPLHPDVALFLVGANDWNYAIRQRFGQDPQPTQSPTFYNTLLGKALAAGFNYLLPPDMAAQKSRQTIGAAPPGHFRAGRGILTNSLERATKDSWLPDAISPDYRANLLRISDVCRDNKLICVFITQPTAYSNAAPQAMQARYWMTPNGASSYTLTLDSMEHIAGLYNHALTHLAEERGHPVCDMAPEVPPTPDYFYDDMHYTTAGDALVSRILTDCLVPILRTRAEANVRHSLASAQENASSAQTQ